MRVVPIGDKTAGKFCTGFLCGTDSGLQFEARPAAYVFQPFKLLADPPRRALRHVLAREGGIRCPEGEESLKVPPREDRISPGPARHTAEGRLPRAQAVEGGEEVE